MCRIDAPFGNRSLDEKTDPVARFDQALDEHDVSGQFRDLFLKNFSDDWESIFRGISGLERVLNEARLKLTEAEKCISVLLSKKDQLAYYFINEDIELPPQEAKLFNFAKDIQKSFFLHSPYGFYSSGMNKFVGNYSQFFHRFYGERFNFTQAFFDNELINSLSDVQRDKVFWDQFVSLSEGNEESGDSSMRCRRIEERLIAIGSSALLSGPPTKASINLSKGIEFLKAWVKYDAMSGRLTSKYKGVLSTINDTWHVIKEIKLEDGPDKEGTKLLFQRLEELKTELIETFLVNIRLDLLTELELESWGQELNSIISRAHKDNCHFDSVEKLQELKDKEAHELNRLCTELSTEHLRQWIKWSINKDFSDFVKDDRRRSTDFFYSKKWINERHGNIWKDEALEGLNNLDIEDKLRLLSNNLPFDSCLNCNAWWRGLFANLINQESFPKQLKPSWTAAALSQRDYDVLPKDVDQSIGILRGQLSKEDTSDKAINEQQQQLETLLSFFDKADPWKSLRHRLLLMRSSTDPIADQSLYKRCNSIDWYLPLSEVANQQFDNLNKLTTISAVVPSEDNTREKDFYFRFTQELAEFFLGRLRLRKKEKALNGRYESEQVIESSMIWRQGYLKALTELGFDLDGKVHKTVNFIKKSDPDPDVRSIASECYKSVRRKKKGSFSSQDLKRGIIAAEWWLLLCQRRELGLEIDFEAALKTRRNLMRHP